MKSVQSKTFCNDFDEQLDIVEKLYGQHLKFDFSEDDIVKILENELYYGEEVKRRVFDILLEQKRKYKYLFIS